MRVLNFNFDSNSIISNNEYHNLYVEFTCYGDGSVDELTIYDPTASNYIDIKDLCEQDQEHVDRRMREEADLNFIDILQDEFDEESVKQFDIATDR